MWSKTLLKRETDDEKVNHQTQNSVAKINIQNLPNKMAFVTPVAEKFPDDSIQYIAFTKIYYSNEGSNLPLTSLGL